MSTEEATTQPQLKSKILIAEDDSFLLLAVKDKLSRAGFDVITAVNGIEALEKMRSFKPDLVLLDLVMPQKGGFDTLEDVQRDKALKKIPIIILSNLGHESDVKKAEELGAVDYIVKANFSLKKVVEKVKFYLAKS
jgi:DNA-binding response OmpR family regulator